MMDRVAENDVGAGIARVAPVVLDETVPEGMVRVYLDIPVDDADSLAMIFGLHKLFSARRVPVVPPAEPPVAAVPPRRRGPGGVRYLRGLAVAALAWATLMHGDFNHDGVVQLSYWAARHAGLAFDVVRASPVLS